MAKTMSANSSVNIMAARRKRDFRSLAQELLALDDAIKWIALEEAGCEPRWAWRDSETGRLCAGTTSYDAELVDPLLLMLAEGRENLYDHETGPELHHLLFVVLAYADLVQIVARFGPDAYVSVAADRRTDAYSLGTELTHLLNQYLEQAVIQ
jgi:hypothetical protein